MAKMFKHNGTLLWESKAHQDRSTLRGEPDPVNSPAHYTTGDIETIDYIRDKLDPAKFLGYCIGNVLKYVSRFDKKGEPAEDLEKAKVYLGWAIDAVKEEETEMADFKKDLSVALAKAIVGGPAGKRTEGFSADDWYHEEFGDDSQDQV